ncbi:hypothetical protein T484DRAFT_1894724 [Baffinella frigidus]|nr:hypothetical protein T484DRAFT_1894724 [Cryptophyta sp. CCMP2293]
MARDDGAYIISETATFDVSNLFEDEDLDIDNMFARVLELDKALELNIGIEVTAADKDNVHIESSVWSRRGRSVSEGGAFLPKTNTLCEKRETSLGQHLHTSAAPDHVAEETTDGVNDRTAGAYFPAHAAAGARPGRYLPAHAARSLQRGGSDGSAPAAGHVRLRPSLQDMYSRKYLPRSVSQPDLRLTKPTPMMPRGFEKPMPLTYHRAHFPDHRR